MGIENDRVRLSETTTMDGEVCQRPAHACAIHHLQHGFTLLDTSVVLLPHALHVLC